MSAEIQQKLKLMASLQEKFNTTVHPKWRTQGFAYYRAIWIECAELLDHYGWKWWKHQELDLDQVKLELVDIWHFGLSDLIRAGTEAEAEKAFTSDLAEQLDFCTAVESLASLTLASKKFSATAFCQVLTGLPMAFDELFELYVGKNVLNKFRQDHGYQTGEYRKLWAGREDNEHLVELLAEMNAEIEQIPDVLYEALSSRYEQTS